MVELMQVAVLLALLQFCLTRFAGAQDVVCESLGLCEETSKGCMQNELTECTAGMLIQNGGRMYATYEYFDEMNEGIANAGRTTSCETHTGMSELTNMTLESVVLDYVSISPKYVSVCASWNLTASSGQNGGFAVKYKHRGRVHYRSCVTNSSARKLCFNNLEYSNLLNGRYSIQVHPFPQPGDADENHIGRTATVRSDITGCADVGHNAGTCGPKHYNKPRNVTVTSCLHEDGKDLRISWEPPYGTEDLPETYFLTLYFDNNRMRRYFNVTNSLQATVRNLSMSFNYSVEVRAYGRCVGLGDYYVNDWLGCGVITKSVNEMLTKCVDPTASTSPSYTVAISGFNESSDLPLERTLEGAVLYATIFSIIFGIFLIILVVTIVVSVLIYVIPLFHSRCRTIYPFPPEKPKIFVFYPPSMTESRQRTVQEQIVCPLLEYFEVVTPNDISSGNISIWLEDTVKSVDRILLVGNKEFCCDWKRSKDERSPVMNSLELLISSAAAQDDISRYCFVSAENTVQDVFIPDNSYLKVMPVYLLPVDIDKLYQFVTKSRGIELTIDAHP